MYHRIISYQFAVSLTVSKFGNVFPVYMKYISGINLHGVVSEKGI